MSYILHRHAFNVTPLGQKMCPEVLTGKQQSIVHKEVEQQVLKNGGGGDWTCCSDNILGIIFLYWWLGDGLVEVKSISTG